ncbi:glycoside hydrolase family 61 protein [Phyllosticta citriasiana]|uniref:AA9 family lytic polysaccharide monooxygenase n=1 Tax=Phyllosticta citriasiana TaxID=595635 RepID=A0ABR1KNQ8_9PEZI
MKSTLFACLATASLVSAHATWQDLWINSKDQAETCVRLPVSNSPVQDVTSNDMRCNAGTSAVESTCSVTAGDTLTVEMHQQDGDRSCSTDAIGGNHYGPVLIYMSKVDDATTADGSGDWFKVAQDTYNGTTEGWGTEILNANCGKRTFTVPSTLAAGDYLVRSEAIALHSAGSEGGAQFYMSCYQVKVTGGGSATPTGVKFPGAYKASDPGILINIYSTPLTYTAPGPDIWSGAAAADRASSAAAATSTAASAAATTAAASSASATPVAAASSTAAQASSAQASVAQANSTPGYKACRRRRHRNLQ